MLIFTMQHSGGLKEAIKKCKRISLDNFIKLVDQKIYDRYGYDERIKATRFILNDMQNNIGLPTWLIIFDQDVTPEYLKKMGVIY